MSWIGMNAEFVLNLGNRSVCVVVVACVNILVHKDLFPQMGYCNVAVEVAVAVSAQLSAGEQTHLQFMILAYPGYLLF